MTLDPKTPAEITLETIIELKNETIARLRKIVRTCERTIAVQQDTIEILKKARKDGTLD